MIKLLALFLAICITGCAAPRIAPEVEKRIQSVGVVTLIPETASFTKIGFTVFNNERSEFDMGGQIGTTTLSSARTIIAKARPQWRFKEVAYDRQALITQSQVPGRTMEYDSGRIKQELAKVAQDNKVDALFVLRPQRYEYVPGVGAGIWILGGMNMSSIRSAVAHNNFALMVFNPSGELIASALGYPELPKPIDPVAYGLKYELQENMNPQLLDRLRAEIVAHLQKAIATRFDQLGIQ